MASTETSNIIWKMVLRFSSCDLAAIQAENNLLASYKGLSQTVFDFAQQVNQMCVKFFKENSFVSAQHEEIQDNFDDPDPAMGRYIPESFWSFNKKVLAYYNSYFGASETQPVLVQRETQLKENLDAICDKLSTENSFADNNFSYLSDIFDEACWFYYKICIKHASLELHRTYEKIKSYFEQLSFDVFAVVDLSPLYLTGKYQENFDRMKEKNRILENVLKYAEEHPDMSYEEAAQKNRELGEALPSPSEIQQLEYGFTEELSLFKTIPLTGVKFFIKADDKMQEYTLPELLQRHAEYNKK